MQSNKENSNISKKSQDTNYDDLESEAEKELYDAFVLEFTKNSEDGTLNKEDFLATLVRF